MATVAQLLRSGASQLQQGAANAPQAGDAAQPQEPDSYRRDAEILLGHCLGKPRAWLYTWPEHAVSGAALQCFEDCLARRSNGEPVAYLTGVRQFWTLDLGVTAATLIPREETELLVSRALELPLPAAAAVLDLGTGSGAIALAVAAERPGWEVTGVDASADTLAVAQSNGERNNLRRVNFLLSDWFAAVPGRRFHLLLSNPPYIDAADPHLERGDLPFEPRRALVAAEQGLADLRYLIQQAPRYLHDGGWLLLEHGMEQGGAVRDLLREAGFTAVETARDMAGLERVSEGCWHAR